MIATSNEETHVLTLSKFGMAKRSVLGDGEMHNVLDAQGEQVWDDRTGKPKLERDGYRKTNRGMNGVRTMNLNEAAGDEIVRVHTIPDLGDQIFLLTGKGMMIRVRADQTKETTGKVTKGTRVMELRDRDKGGFVDEIIFSARLPAVLIDEEDAEPEAEPVVDDEEE
jgi:DNA gyrase/topoisomerase IV subunit A